MCADGSDGPDQAARPDRAGPRQGPGPVTDKFGRVGFYRRLTVTPPSYWRRAAWLIVASASVVLVVLVFGAVRLAGPNGRSGQVDAFPGLPTGGLLTPQPPRTNTLVMPPTPGHNTDQSNADQGDAGQSTARPSTQPQADMRTSIESPAGGSPTGQPPDPDGGIPTGGPPSTGSATPSPEPDAAAVMDATGRFFGLLPEDIDNAWLMMNAEGQRPNFAEFSRSWRRYRDVELLHATAGAEATTTIASVRVTERKGTSTTQRWKLTFGRGGQPVINELVLLDPAPQAGPPVNTP
jgi:hypothetical protein